MKVLGYQVEQKQVQEMISALDESGKGVISKDGFKKFMTARMVTLASCRIIETINNNWNLPMNILIP